MKRFRIVPDSGSRLLSGLATAESHPSGRDAHIPPRAPRRPSARSNRNPRSRPARSPRRQSRSLRSAQAGASPNSNSAALQRRINVIGTFAARDQKRNRRCIRRRDDPDLRGELRLMTQHQIQRIAVERPDIDIVRPAAPRSRAAAWTAVRCSRDRGCRRAADRYGSR